MTGDWCDPKANYKPCDAVFRVDLTTGKRTLISAFTEADYDLGLDNPNSQLALDRTGIKWENVVIASTGDIFVYSNERDKNSYIVSPQFNGLYRISAANGSRSLASNLSDVRYGPTIIPSAYYRKMVITPTDQILVVTGNDEYKLIKMNPFTGQRILLSDSWVTSQGSSFDDFIGIDQSGRLYAWASIGNLALEYNLIQIDAETGNRSIVRKLTDAPSDHIYDELFFDTVGNFTLVMKSSTLAVQPFCLVISSTKIKGR